MIVYINDNNEIKDVNYTDNDTLTAVTISDDNNPFKGWSVAKICCFRVVVVNGVVASMSPYIDTRIVERMDKLDSQIANLELAVAELYSMIVEG